MKCINPEEERKIFSLFSPTVRNHIYSEGWDSLREIQVRAAEKIFFSSCDLLISSGTATGKTEAAFFPILSLLEQKENDSLVLYISPVKALINDQFDRLGLILKEGHIPLYHYHGDVSQHHKEDFFKDPKGILQITPESLESLFLRKWDDIPRLFGSLKYVIVDEIHALMNSDRGNQVLCLLKRMENAIGHRPRRIGLSATLSSTEKTSFWFSSGENDTHIIQTPGDGQRLRIGIEHFETKDKLHNFVYRATKNMKSIVFSNTREEAENITTNLKTCAENKKENDRFYVHHASLPSTTRKEAEEKLRSDEKEVTVVATTTLEYGIDIEQLKRIICLQSPLSVSSFLQRLGRSGRREAPPEMLLALSNREKDEDDLDLFPFELLQAISIIELYRKERFIEEAKDKKLYSSLIFHQTLTVLSAEGEKSATELAKRILSLPPFCTFPKEAYKDLLIHMIKMDYLELTENKTLVPGIKGERMISSYQFLSVFQDRVPFTVYLKNERIGSISSVPPIGEGFSLGGKIWEVEDTDLVKKAVYVRPGKSVSKGAFRGSEVLIDEKILEKMKEILLNTENYPYLFPSAKEELSLARKTAKELLLSKNAFLPLGGMKYVLLPFVGTKTFETIRRIFQNEIASRLPISEVKVHSPYYLSFQLSENPKKAKESIREIIMGLNPEELSFIAPGELPIYDKFDSFLPKSLLNASFEENRLKKEEAIKKLREIFQ